MKTRKPAGTFMLHTLALLCRSDKTLPEIATATGLSFYWLRNFKSRRYADPSVNTIQLLYEFLAGEHLRLHDPARCPVHVKFDRACGYCTRVRERFGSEIW